MPSVRQAFDAFLQELELSAAERERASKQHEYLRAELRARMRGIDRDVLVGSYQRHTAIRPLNDIDVFLVLSRAQHGTRTNSAPQLILEDVLRHVRAIYAPAKPEARMQGRSVNVTFSGTGIGYDLIPAFAPPNTPPNPRNSLDLIYQIPDRGQQGWISTNPERHRARLVKANDLAGGMLNRIIKAAKFWNCRKADAGGSRPMRSFHIEAMAYAAFNGRPTSERHGLLHLLEHMASRVTYGCADPGELGPNVDADLTPGDRTYLQQLLREATALASVAIQHETRGDDASAIATWQRLLGKEAMR